MSNRTKMRLLRSSAIVLAMAVMPTAQVHANPQGGKVVSGEVTISTPDSKTLEVNQNTQNAIIDWRRFDIEADETTRFVQPNSDAWILNRIVGSTDPSRILGTLEANGNVVIVNTDGIYFGLGSRVDVNRLIATTHDITNDNFIDGNYIFDGQGNPSASIVNEGDISIADYGLGAFVAPAVRNSGTITARLGIINLASGNQFTIDPYGDGLIKLAVDDEITGKIYDVSTGKQISDLVKNEGVLKADGGIVALSAATARQVVNSVINNTGIIETNTIGFKNGKIILSAQTAETKKKNAPKQKIIASGRINATAYPIPKRIAIPTLSPRRGGHIEIIGETIELTSADIDVSGEHGGGTVIIGGDYMGGNGSAEKIEKYGIQLESKKYSNATTVTADKNTSINASALSDGNGGKIILWSDLTTNTAAKITARGGSLSGDGGFVETSGKINLHSGSYVDAGATNGFGGTWLLDPENAQVNASEVSATLNSGTNFILTATNHIDMRGNILKTSGGDTTFELNSGNSMNVEFSAISSSGNLNISLTAPYMHAYLTNVDTNGGDIDINYQNSEYGLAFRGVSTDGGDVTINYNNGYSGPFALNGYFSSLTLDTGGGDLNVAAFDDFTSWSTNLNLGGGTATFRASEVRLCAPCSASGQNHDFAYAQSAYRDISGSTISDPGGSRISNGILNVIIDGVDVSPSGPTPPTPVDNDPTHGTNPITEINHTNGGAALNLNIENLFADDNGVTNLTITAIGQPSGVSVIDNNDGTISITSGSGVNLPVENHTITITAEDASGQTVSRTITLSVTNPVVTQPVQNIDVNVVDVIDITPKINSLVDGEIESDTHLPPSAYQENSDLPNAFKERVFDNIYKLKNFKSPENAIQLAFDLYKLINEGKGIYSARQYQKLFIEISQKFPTTAAPNSQLSELNDSFGEGKVTDIGLSILWTYLTNLTLDYAYSKFEFENAYLDNVMKTVLRDLIIEIPSAALTSPAGLVYPVKKVTDVMIALRKLNIELGDITNTALTSGKLYLSLQSTGVIGIDSALRQANIVGEQASELINSATNLEGFNTVAGRKLSIIADIIRIAAYQYDGNLQLSNFYKLGLMRRVSGYENISVSVLRTDYVTLGFKTYGDFAREVGENIGVEI